MSLAKLSIIEKSRKEFECSKCGETIPKGSSTVRFSVGFRGRVQTRHNPKCFPKPSERESSIIADIYAAQEDFDISGLETVDDITSAIGDVQSACDEVIQQYSDNPTYDGNDDLQERVSTIESARDELDQWESNIDVADPGEESEMLWDEDSYESWQAHHDAYVEAMRDAANNAVDNMELP